MNSSDRTPYAYVTIQVCPTEISGRTGPVFASCFRSWLFNFGGEYWGCFLFLDDIGPLYPGQRHSGVPFDFLVPDRAPELHVGMKFYFTEGEHRVAEGEVERIPTADKSK